MPITNVWLRVDGSKPGESLREALEHLHEAAPEATVDFSSVARMDSSALTALESLAAAAEGNGVHVVLRNVNITVYKALTVMKIAARFTF
jgi:anti-anti-sigma regulatory factor